MMMRRCTLLVTLLVWPLQVDAAQVLGINIPERITVDGKDLQLNGVGVREATVFKVDVYVAGLYLQKKTSNAKEVIESQQIKRVFQHFVRDVDRDDVIDAWKTGMRKTAGGGYSALKARVETLSKWMADMEEGQTMSYTFIPKTGVIVHVNGTKKGALAGDDFAVAMWRVWFGSEPPNEGLKSGMLGKK